MLASGTGNGSDYIAERLDCPALGCAAEVNNAVLCKQIPAVYCLDRTCK